MRRYRLPALGAVIGLTFTLVSCGPESSGSGDNQMSYKEVKSMVIDILGSQEAQQALEKAQSAQYGESTLHMKGLTVQDQEQVRIAVKDILTSPDYSKVLETIMKNPKFAGEFAKAVSSDNKQIHKDLMKDPTYQSELVSTFKTPEMQRILFDAMKSTEYRKQIQASVSESIQNPLFKLEIMKLLQTVVKEELTPTAKESGKKEGGQEGEGGKSNDSGGSSGG
ncbi:spore germination lipoprotein GerD [Cohnella faecalis]|uniref:Spore gernimation protein n=1 Tax=Cohnella faecalis TaxID=2315694 RepID=A0A398D1H0_9BACL|nr:spore germination lipoprotein GerD [Cohnella faecalis]RIE05024.1 spore gernimation protein [Cohnella faecalis]